jgi:hypothetical protein
MLNAEALPRLRFPAREVPREDEAARREPRLRGFLLNSDHQETQHSSLEATLFMEFTAARVTARIFEAAIREVPTCCDRKSQ